jgi:DNA polymerase epsilon subunit 1
MDFALTIEPGHQNKDEITNYEEVRLEIERMLVSIRDQCPRLVTTPLIYHVDVGAMYPNIILTNRLQPTSIVNDQICAGCIYNKDENNCKRKLDW